MADWNAGWMACWLAGLLVAAGQAGQPESPPSYEWLRRVIAELAPAKAKTVAMTELVSQSIG